LAYRLVIFDFDGTLADSGDWFISMVNDVAARFRFRQVTEAEVDMLRSRSSREVVRYMGVPAWKMPFIARHARKLVAANASQIAMFEGAEAVLRRLHDQGIKLALVSSNAEANVREIMGPACADLFEQFNCGASLYGKTRKFNAVIRKARVERSEVLSVGDETRDIEAAAKAGIASGAVTWGYQRPELLAAHKPTHLIDSLADIPDLVK